MVSFVAMSATRLTGSAYIKLEWHALRLYWNEIILCVCIIWQSCHHSVGKYVITLHAITALTNVQSRLLRAYIQLLGNCHQMWHVSYISSKLLLSFLAYQGLYTIVSLVIRPLLMSLLDNQGLYTIVSLVIRTFLLFTLG